MFSERQKVLTSVSSPTVTSSPPVVAWLRTFRPRRGPVTAGDVARAAGGAFAGILVTALVGRGLSWGPTELAWLVAPMGASSVLLFAVPASPLAQPWSLMGGNVSAGFVGIAAAHLFDDPRLAAAVGVSAAIAVMILLGCTHPPAGAVALTASLGGPAIQQQGFAFALWPVGVNSLCLLLVAVAFNNLSGRRYPHVAPPPMAAAQPTADVVPTVRAGVQVADVEAAMRERGAAPDMLPEDVVALVREAEVHAMDRRLGGMRVADLMARDVVTASEHDSLYRVRLLLNQHAVKAVPVLDEGRRVVGIVSITDLFNRDPGDLDPVATVMTRDVTTIGPDAPAAALITLMADVGYRHVPVVDDVGVLAGLVTRAELVAALTRALLDQA